MPRKITIDPITRVEGHGKITIHLDKAGHVKQSRLHVVEFRGFEKFVQAFKSAEKKYKFYHIRFPQNFAELQITTSKTFIEWITTISKSKLRDQLFSLYTKPFLDDLDQDEVEIYFKSEYTIDDKDVPNKDAPIGLPIAFIKSFPAISIDSHKFWRNRKIYFSKVYNNAVKNATSLAYNICQPDDINSDELNEWANNCMSKFIDSQDILTNYLSFSKYTPFFTDNFMEQLFEWKANDTEQYKYLLLLMKDVELHPYAGGMGKTENLRQRGKEASKQITQLDRLSYTLENNIVNFIACKGHYDFH